MHLLHVKIGFWLVSMHTFTGCDTVSAFAGKGKAFKMLSNSKYFKGYFYTAVTLKEQSHFIAVYVITKN